MKEYMFRLFLLNGKCIYVIENGTDISDAYRKIIRNDIKCFSFVEMDKWSKIITKE
jgi:hypothetical protein